MNLNFVRFGSAIVAMVVAGAIASPAEAVSLAGKQLSFAGGARIDDLGNGLDSMPGGQIRFNFGDFANTTSGTAFVVPFTSDPVFGAGPLALLDLTLNQTSATTWSLATASVPSFITGLATGAPGAFDLTRFDLFQLGSGDTLAFEALVEGVFNPPGLPGLGELTTQAGALSLRGSSFSADITAVPTPALLPAALGFGAAMLRKRKGEKAEKEAANAKA
ncbi:PTPA-CTERM sorting domain-containing protein [Leptolyngbya sp. GB1-A1]|uniref:PTPA-CTERM sorting domain-containing protein n=1 Tax=Leptolyngbya sp. GB1-A1 TaxID=2933908 RepID=UPI003298538E